MRLDFSMRLSVFYDQIRNATKQTGQPISAVCAQVKSFGIDGVDLHAADLCAETLEPLQAAGLHVSSIYSFFDFAAVPDPAPGLALLEKAHNCNINAVLAVPGSCNNKVGFEQSRRNMRDALIPMCAYAAKLGIQLCMEDFDDSCTPYATADGLLWFMEQVEGLGCTFDTGNFLYSEENALAALEKLLPYVRYVHCKDRSLVPNKSTPVTKTVSGRALYAAAVGSGVVPMREILLRLAACGYSGVYAIELFGSPDDLRDIQASARWLTQILETNKTS